MSRRSEVRQVRVERELEVQVWSCDTCGQELTTSRQAFFGDERLVVEGEDRPWYSVAIQLSKHDYPVYLRSRSTSAQRIA